MWDPQCLTTLWASMAYYRDTFTFTYLLETMFDSDIIISEKEKNRLVIAGVYR
jgi:hypothetical protein